MRSHASVLRHHGSRPRWRAAMRGTGSRQSSSRHWLPARDRVGTHSGRTIEPSRRRAGPPFAGLVILHWIDVVRPPCGGIPGPCSLRQAETDSCRPALFVCTKEVKRGLREGWSCCCVRLCRPERLHWCWSGARRQASVRTGGRLNRWRLLPVDWDSLRRLRRRPRCRRRRPRQRPPSRHQSPPQRRAPPRQRRRRRPSRPHLRPGTGSSRR